MPPQHGAAQEANEPLVEWRLQSLEKFQEKVLEKFDALGKWLFGILGTLIVYLIVMILQLMKKG